MRIMFELDRDDDEKIRYRDFKNSKLMKAVVKLTQVEEVNSVRDFFIYEHFYVIYCRFFELDLDHDEYISKEDFSKYSRHTLGSKVV
jgi:serine/threonine-protein phosphatase 2A regulatory subunit B''